MWEAAAEYGSMLRRASEGWRFLVEQIEGPGQYDRVLQSVGPFRDLYPALPAAVVTNFGGLDTPEKAQPLIAAGLACICEGHVREDGVDPRQRVDWAERVLGWPSPQPMAGLGNGATLADYPGIDQSAGWSVFSAEYLFQ